MNEQKQLVAHLMRRAGFGATKQEIESLASLEYEKIVESLVYPSDRDSLPDDLIRRYHVDQNEMRLINSAVGKWVYKISPACEIGCHRTDCCTSCRLMSGPEVPRAVSVKTTWLKITETAHSARPSSQPTSTRRHIETSAHRKGREISSSSSHREPST